MTQPIQTSTKVLGTARTPDGVAHGEIAGLIINQTGPKGGYYLLDMRESIERAQKGLLWTTPPSGWPRAEVEAIDANNDGYDDSVRTVPDGSTTNNLLALPIYDRRTGSWSPSPPRG